MLGSLMEFNSVSGIERGQTAVSLCLRGYPWDALNNSVHAATRLGVKCLAVGADALRTDIGDEHLSGAKCLTDSQRPPAIFRRGGGRWVCLPQRSRRAMDTRFHAGFSFMIAPRRECFSNAKEGSAEVISQPGRRAMGHAATLSKEVFSICEFLDSKVARRSSAGGFHCWPLLIGDCVRGVAETLSSS